MTNEERKRRHISAVRKAAAKRSAEVRMKGEAVKIRIRRRDAEIAKCAARRDGIAMIDWISDAIQGHQ